MSLERKVHFFKLPWDNHNLQESQTSVFLNVVLLINFPEQFKLFFYFKYWRSYEVLKSGSQNF